MRDLPDASRPLALIGLRNGLDGVFGCDRQFRRYNCYGTLHSLSMYNKLDTAVSRRHTLARRSSAPEAQPAGTDGTGRGLTLGGGLASLRAERFVQVVEDGRAALKPSGVVLRGRGDTVN